MPLGVCGIGNLGLAIKVQVRMIGLVSQKPCTYTWPLDDGSTAPDTLHPPLVTSHTPSTESPVKGVALATRIRVEEDLQI